MKRINITLISPSKVLSAYKSNSEYQAWIDACITSEVWGAEGNYTIEVLDATAELENKRNALQAATKVEFDFHVNSVNNPHSVTKAQVGLESVDNISASDLRNRSTHTGTQSASTINDFNEAAQDAVGNALIDSADIDFNYPDVDNQISADLTPTGVVAGTYSLVTVDNKGRVTVGSNTGSITRYSYVTTTTTSRNGTTFVDVSGLTSASLPVGLYAFKFFGRLQSGSTTNGTGLRINVGTASVSTCNINWFIDQGSSGTQQSFQYSQTTLETNITSASPPAANSTHNAQGNGVIRVTSAGTLKIEIRSELANTASSILEDSFMVLELI